MQDSLILFSALSFILCHLVVESVFLLAFSKQKSVFCMRGVRIWLGNAPGMFVNRK